MSELITTYLNQSGKKSFYYFLRHYRDEIIVMIPVTSRWKDLDNAWSTKFITGAGKLGEDLSRKVCIFLFCKVKVTSSRSTHCLGELLGMTRWVTSPQFIYSGALALSLVKVY
jgi:hypothetical protein